MFFYTFIPKLINMSLTASVAIVLVMLLRLPLKRAPKVISYALWGIVLFRLLCPVSIESSLSLFGLFDAPAAESDTLTSTIEYVPADIVHTEYPSVVLHVPGVSEAINETLPQDREQLAAGPLAAPMVIAAYIWMTGVLVMTVYSAASYLRLRQKLMMAARLRDNIYLVDEISSPFVLGLLRPKIYLPSAIGEQEQSYILLHEQHHIRRLDHIAKALAFVALCIHWFNPLVWAAFILSGKDMEMSCDEAVVKKMGDGVLADYTASLLSLATGKHIIAGMPLAFGEGDTRGRIHNLAKWKKPAIWVVLIAVAACIALAVGLLTNPAAEREFPINGSNVSELDTERIVENLAKVERLEHGSQLCVNGDNFDLMFTSDFDWANDGAIRFFYMKNQKTYGAQLRMFHDENKYFITDSSEWIEQEKIFLLAHYLDALKYMPQEAIRQLSPDADGYCVIMRHDGTPGDYERVLKYSQNGVNDSDGWYIHLEVQPLHEADGEGYFGSGDEMIHLFYHESGINEPAQIGTSRKLTLDDVSALSEKGYDLSWDDFEEYGYIETGSGVYIRLYEINNLFSLWIGGDSPDSDPMYIYLALADDIGTRIDIRDGGVEEFIVKDHSGVRLANAINTAILDNNKPSEPDGLLHFASFVLLGQEELCIESDPPAPMQVTAYGIALYQAYGFSGHTFHIAVGSHIPTAITFEVVDGKYIMKEYWIPRDGSYYASDIRDKFPDDIEDEAMDTPEYLLAQKQECYDQAVRYGGVDTDYAVEYLFEVIESSPAASSRPADYIDEHPIEYRELTYYGDYTLKYIFSKFLEGEQTGLRGHLMRAVLDELAPEAQLRLHAETGQEYFDEWKAGAVRVSEQHDMDWIKENQPAMYLLLQMIDE